MENRFTLGFLRDSLGEKGVTPTDLERQLGEHKELSASERLSANRRLQEQFVLPLQQVIEQNRKQILTDEIKKAQPEYGKVSFDFATDREWLKKFGRLLLSSGFSREEAEQAVIALMMSKFKDKSDRDAQQEATQILHDSMHNMS